MTATWRTKSFGVEQVLASSISSAETFGLPICNPQETGIFTVGIDSREAFGGSVIQPGKAEILTQGIASAEFFGTTKISTLISPVGISSGEGFGVSALTSNVLTQGISSQEGFGGPTLTRLKNSNAVLENTVNWELGLGLPKEINFTAPNGSDVFCLLSTDRGNGSGINEGWEPLAFTYGGVSMVKVGSVNHNNNKANGGIALYRSAAGGTGASKVVKLGNGLEGWNGWLSISAFAVSGVESASVTTVYGENATPSQTITHEDGVTLQVFGLGLYSVQSMETLTGATKLGVNNSYASSVLSRVTTSANVVLSLSSSAKWSSMKISII